MYEEKTEKRQPFKRTDRTKHLVEIDKHAFRIIWDWKLFTCVFFSRYVRALPCVFFGLFSALGAHIKNPTYSHGGILYFVNLLVLVVRGVHAFVFFQSRSFPVGFVYLSLDASDETKNTKKILQFSHWKMFLADWMMFPEHQTKNAANKACTSSDGGAAPNHTCANAIWCCCWHIHWDFLSSLSRCVLCFLCA